MNMRIWSSSKGTSLKAIMQMFFNETKANEWFVERRWPDGIRCAYPTESTSSGLNR